MVPKVLLPTTPLYGVDGLLSSLALPLTLYIWCTSKSFFFHFPLKATAHSSGYVYIYLSVSIVLGLEQSELGLCVVWFLSSASHLFMFLS